MRDVPSGRNALSKMRIKARGNSKFLIACLMILGTSIGAGMLGMPVEMGRGGAIPSTFFLVITWIVLLITGLLFLEVMSFVRKDVNFATLSEMFLKSKSKSILVFIYLLLFLALLFAYVKGGGVFISGISSKIPIWLGTVIYLAIFFPFMIKGTRMIGKINAFLSTLMILSFILLLIFGLKKIHIDNLIHIDWKNSYLSSPILVTAFGFHIVIPSLYAMLNRNKALMRWAIIIGTTSSLVVYFLWNSYVIGIIPLSGEVSLSSALQSDQTAITPLAKILGSSIISQFAQIFYFCALTTSFLGVSLATIDFSLDALQLKKVSKNRILIAIFIFVPALILSTTQLRLFYLSLKYGAAIACILLLIIFPALLVIKIIPKLKEKKSKYQISLLKQSLYFVFIFALSAFIAQILNFTNKS